MTQFRCTNYRSITEDIAAFELSPIHHKLDFIPGQYVEIAIPNLESMPVSIVNTPNPYGKLSFHLRHDKAHPNANLLCHYLKTGNLVRLSTAKGRCVLNDPQDKNLLFLAGGTGISPYLSILSDFFENITNKNLPSKIQLIWGVKATQDLYALDILQKWQEKFPPFEYYLILSEMQNGSSDWKGLKGWLHDLLPIFIKNSNDMRIYTCGPFPMVQKCYQQALKLGLDKQLFFSDMIEP